jgi:hypothetical protein
MSVFPTVAVEVELNGAGGGWTNIAADVLRELSVVMRHGIQGSHPTDRVATTGTATFALNNSERNSAGTLGYYSPHHASVRAGWGLGIACRVRITDPASALTYTRFIGHVDAIRPMPGVNGPRVVRVTVVDWMDEAARWRLTPAVGEQEDVDWVAVTTALIAQMPMAPVSTSYQGGSETYPYVLDTSALAQQSVLAEFRKLAGSEHGLIYIKADGTLRLEDRHYRMSVGSSAWTLTDAEYQALELPSTRDDIINTVRVTTHPKVVDAVANVVVYDQANTIIFTAGETKILMGSFRDQDTGDPIGATDIQAQVSGTDYVANTLADGSGSNVSSSFTVVVETGSNGVRFTVTNATAAVAYLLTLRLIGKGIYDYGRTIHDATDTASITTHGEHVVDFDMPYQAQDAIGQAAAAYILAKYKDPLTHVRAVTVAGRTAALLTQLLTRDISDRVTVSETVTGVNDAFFINGIDLRVEPAGFLIARYVLSPTDDPATGSYFLIDTSSINGADVLAPF